MKTRKSILVNVLEKEDIGTWNTEEEEGSMGEKGRNEKDEGLMVGLLVRGYYKCVMEGGGRGEVAGDGGEVMFSLSC